MVQEPKRIAIEVDTAGVGIQKHARFGPGSGSIIRRLTNYHNIWGSFSVEPQTADANANGWWILWLKPDVTQTDPAFTKTVINAQDFNQMIIACGTWMASNQTPFNKEIHLNSSRNLVANMELVLTVRQDGITAGNSQLNIMLCAGLSVK